MKKITFFPDILILVIFTFINYYPAYAHSGRTDARGGHYDSKTGKYHYHNSGHPQPTQKLDEPESESEPINIQKLATTDALSHLNFDANMDITWYATGFFLNVFGIGASYFLTPNIPTTNLVGKSPEYVETYTCVYQSEMKKNRIKKASQGCLASSLLIYYYFSLKTGYTLF